LQSHRHQRQCVAQPVPSPRPSALPGTAGSSSAAAASECAAGAIPTACRAPGSRWPLRQVARSPLRAPISPSTSVSINSCGTASAEHVGGTFLKGIPDGHFAYGAYQHRGTSHRPSAAGPARELRREVELPTPGGRHVCRPFSFPPKSLSSTGTSESFLSFCSGGRNRHRSLGCRIIRSRRDWARSPFCGAKEMADARVRHRCRHGAWSGRCMGGSGAVRRLSFR
jgi:hypothetical protein